MEIIIAFIILVIVFLVFWYVAKKRDEKILRYRLMIQRCNFMRLLLQHQL